MLERLRRRAVYRLEDDVRAYWLNKLAETNFSGLTPEIQANVLTYYSDLDTPFDTKKNPKQWNRYWLSYSN